VVFKRNHALHDSIIGGSMNKDQIEGNWEQFKGKIKQTWGKMTDDDIALANGKRQEFLGKVQESYGIGAEEAEKQFSELEKSCNYGQKKSNAA
jgi:uncharacterized protein YjbJ (UPF0337 family)